MVGGVHGDELRIGTEERESALTALGDHLAAGRLDVDEYGERAARAAEATTVSALRPLFDDLPPPHPPVTHPAALPDELQRALATEGTLVLATDLPGELGYRNYTEPGVRHRRRTVAVSGTVAVTGRRLIVWAGGAKRVDLPFDHPLRAAVTVTVRPPDLLVVSVDAGAAHPDRSGRVEVRLHTRRAADIAGLWGSR